MAMVGRVKDKSERMSSQVIFFGVIISITYFYTWDTTPGPLKRHSIASQVMANVMLNCQQKIKVYSSNRVKHVEEENAHHLCVNTSVNIRFVHKTLEFTTWHSEPQQRSITCPVWTFTVSASSPCCLMVDEDWLDIFLGSALRKFKYQQIDYQGESPVVTWSF